MHVGRLAACKREERGSERPTVGPLHGNNSVGAPERPPSRRVGFDLRSSRPILTLIDEKRAHEARLRRFSPSATKTGLRGACWRPG